MIDDAIQTRLNGFTGLTALVSTRIYQEPGPENPTAALFPMVVWSRITDTPETSIDGVIVNRTARFQFSAMAKLRSAAGNVREQLILALHNFHDTTILASEFAAAPTFFDPDLMPGGGYHIPVDFEITF